MPVAVDLADVVVVVDALVETVVVVVVEALVEVVVVVVVFDEVVVCN